MLKKWEELPDFMRVQEVKKYYDILEEKRFSIVMKRFFDIIVGCIGLFFLAIPMLIIAICIKIDSHGDVFYRQERVTLYGKKFRIHKFRTMVSNADNIGASVTVNSDNRITRIGRILRKYRLDELPQIFDVIVGDMSFVGTRPEVTKYVEQYSREMYATLLLPAGVTSEASILYKDEAELLNMAEDVEHVYINEVLPQKMKYNLESISKFSFTMEIRTMIRTVFAVLGKEY